MDDDARSLHERGMTLEEAARYDDATDEQDQWWQFGYIVGQRAAHNSLARLIIREQASFNALRPLEDIDDAGQ